MSIDSVFSGFEDKSLLAESEYLQDGIKYCSVCNKPRQITINALGRQYKMPIHCDCQAQVAAEQEALERERQHQERVAKLKKGIVNAKHRTMCFSSSIYNNLDFAQTYVDNFPRYLADNVGLMIMGDTGTGKTYAAACIANALVEQGYSVYMDNIVHITDKMTSLFNADRLDFIERLQRYDLLIIDEFGVSRCTDFMLEQIYSLIDTRYRSNKPMIVTTNLSPKDFNVEDVAYKRIYERIRAVCHPKILNEVFVRKQLIGERYRNLKNELG